VHGMRKVALRGLLAHKGRLVATFLAVALGVAFIGGVLTLTDTMNRTFDDLFADVFRDTDAVVRSDQSISQGHFDGGADARGTLPASVLDEVRRTPGVAAADGSIQGYAQVIDRDGDAVGDPAMGAPTFGANWTDVDDLNPFEIADGRAPRTAGEIAIDRGTANDTDYGVGDRVRVQTQKGVGTFTVVGITRFGTTDNPGGATYVHWTTEEAQRLVGEEARFSSVDVVADPGVSQARVVRSIEQALRADGTRGTEVLTGKQITEENQTDVKDQLSVLTTFFLAFAVIAVFVGTFVIYNSFAIIIAQRTREMALLRAIGASRKQVRRSVVVEAAVVGLVGSVVGFVIGLGVATVLGGLFELPEGSLAIVPTSVATAIVTGVIVTVGSALIPARRASKVPPLAAMRDVEVDTSGGSRVRMGVGILLVALGVVSVVAGATGDEVMNVALGLALTLVGLVFVSPALARPVSTALGRPIARLRGLSGNLATQNAARNPRRTSATAQALMIGVGVVALILVMNSSIRASIDHTLRRSFTGDFVVDSGTFGMVGLPTQVSERLRDIPDVDVVAPLRFALAQVDGEDHPVSATNAGGFDTLGLEIVEGTPALRDALADEHGDLPDGGIVVGDDTAESRHLGVGDRIRTQFVDDRRPAAERTLTVVGIYKGKAGGDLGRYVIGLHEFDRAVPTPTDSQVVVKLADGVSVADAQPEIERVLRPFPTAKVQNVDEYIDSIGKQLDSLLILFGALLALTIVIAMLGIANTIALSVLERTREIGLLRAVGMSRRQLRSAIRWESAIIALFGTLLGLAIGVLGAWGLISALGEEEFNSFRIPVGTLVGVSAFAALMGMAAAILPAWRASRLDVLDAIETP
jgi:putative ABC transport system permease protein